ncbi:hypothetical protein Scep_002031 [Stephania cephalantha]|uniref:Uncharacterized protein n=1 Tax=Stephania cephalantha TaxID=152367 RepID=A0AAP0Q4B2_9MAGN
MGVQLAVTYCREALSMVARRSTRRFNFGNFGIVRLRLHDMGREANEFAKTFTEAGHRVKKKTSTILKVNFTKAYNKSPASVADADDRARDERARVGLWRERRTIGEAEARTGGSTVAGERETARAEGEADPRWWDRRARDGESGGWQARDGES